jgi:hypothetical protein
MSPTPQTPYPQLTASQIASALGVSPQFIRQKQLRAIPATGKRTIAGNEADTWALADLPGTLRSRLERKARRTGYATVPEMFAGSFKAWIPPVPLAEISDACLTETNKRKLALLPSLRRRFVTSPADFERDGVVDWEKVFGQKITTRHFRELIRRTVDRDRGLENYERLELYLTEKPERKREAAETEDQFPGLVSTINAGASPDEIWKKVFATRAALIKAGVPSARADRQLRAFIRERKPGLAPNPDALLKAFGRRLERWQADEPFDMREDNGAEDGELVKQIKALDWFIPAARFFYLLTNRTQNTGSTPEAVLTTISLPNLPAGWPESLKRKLLKAVGQKDIPSCPVELRESILARQREYKSLVPASIAKKIMVNKGIVQFYRSPKEWRLANLSAPGTQRCYSDSTSGRRVPMRPGDWFGGDDATPGIAVCVPCDGVATPSSEKFGVLLGRFQWLAYQDCRTDKILAWDYVIRPRGSYRAEDILNGMGAVVRTHGIPRQGFQFEGGTFNAKLVQQAIKLLGCEHWRTYSPHAKAIESVFNRVWTRLAVQFPHADMGRFRNENEANCKLYEACKRGHKDPRRYFPTLDLVTKVFMEVIATHNAKPINSKQYGRWVPDESFARDVAKQPLREFSSDMDWILVAKSRCSRIFPCLSSLARPGFRCMTEKKSGCILIRASRSVSPKLCFCRLPAATRPAKPWGTRNLSARRVNTSGSCWTKGTPISAPDISRGRKPPTSCGAKRAASGPVVVWNTPRAKSATAFHKSRPFNETAPGRKFCGTEKRPARHGWRKGFWKKQRKKMRKPSSLTSVGYATNSAPLSKTLTARTLNYSFNHVQHPHSRKRQRLSAGKVCVQSRP